MQPELSVVSSMPRRESPLERLADSDTHRHIIWLALAVLVVSAWVRNVNWDEFFFLSHIHANLGGYLDRPMQTAYVHAFGWLAWVPGGEMGQIVAARLVMTLLLGATCISIYKVACTLAGRNAAGIAVVAFLTSGFVMVYGASFRADPIAAASLMVAMAVLMISRVRTAQIVMVALLVAASLLVTVKAVLYLPVFIGIILWRWEDRGLVLRILLSGVIGVGLAAILYFWHASGIVSASGNETANNAQRAFETTLLEGGLFPRGREALLWAFLSIGPIVLACIGLFASKSRRKLCAAIAFILPFALSVALYRNAFPYFFPFITPPLMVVAAMGAARLGRGPVLRILMALMIGTGLVQGAKALSEGAGLQRAILAEVHRLFPEPVSYIDDHAMVATFPRHLFFMSSMGLKHYRAAGKPVMADLIETRQPPLLLANRATLHVAMHYAAVADGPFLLLPEDSATLRQNYVHYSGTIWLAGREITLEDQPIDLAMPFPGRYRVETGDPVNIDGQSFTDGMVIESSGSHVIHGRSGQEVRLVWDTPGAAKPDTLPLGEVYIGFWQLPF